jgi:chemotaxis protein methyltransferase CheR
MKTTDFDYIRNYVRSRAAIVIEPGKEYLVESRLAVLARREKFATIDALVETLRSDPEGFGRHDDERDLVFP